MKYKPSEEPVFFSRSISDAEAMPEPKGVVNIKALDAFGNLIWEETDSNLVVSLGRDAICRLIGAGTANRVVDKVGVGTGSAPTTVGDTALTSVFQKGFSAITYPTTTSMQFAFTILTTEANGLTITEFGLFCNNNNLFSRLVRPGIVKTSSIQLVCTWTLSF